MNLRLAGTSGVVAVALLAACNNSLEAQCKRGDAAACGILGDRVYRASDAGSEVARACALYRMGCRGGNFGACGNLGALLAQQRCSGTRGEAQEVLQRACDHDDLSGCNNLGMIFREGHDGASRDIERAVTYFRKACPRHATACDNLGGLLLDTDEHAAAQAFESGCDGKIDDPGQAGCCFNLGLSYEAGWGVPVDRTKARLLYEFACSRSVAQACFSLGHLELQADAGDRAADLFRRACDMGSPAACNNMGLQYSLGRGVEPDQAKALEYLDRGCSGGELRACANLGSRYFLGESAPSDPARGRELLARACDGGISEACVLPKPSHPR